MNERLCNKKAWLYVGRKKWWARGVDFVAGLFCTRRTTLINIAAI